MTVRAVFALLALGFASQAACQDEDDEGPVSGTAALGYLATSGNTDSTNVNASFNLLWEKPVWSHEFDLSAIRAETSGVTTAEAFSSDYTGRRELTETSYFFTALDYERDEFSAFDEQTSQSIGYGRRPIATERHTLNVEGGLGARQTTSRSGLEEDDRIARFKLDYSWVINDTTEFSQGLVVRSGSANTRTEAVSEIRARLFGAFALVLSYRLRNNSEVEPGTEETDRFTALSIEYAF